MIVMSVGNWQHLRSQLRYTIMSNHEKQRVFVNILVDDEDNNEIDRGVGVNDFVEKVNEFDKLLTTFLVYDRKEKIRIQYFFCQTSFLANSLLFLSILTNQPYLVRFFNMNGFCISFKMRESNIRYCKVIK